MTSSRILIVDDEPFNVDYLEQELADLGYETIAAENGAAALDRVRSEAPDLILLDIMMPVMDGFEVLARLKAVPATRDIPVIVISAASDLNSTVKGIQLGAEDYLPKPFEPTLLHARITSSLEKKRLRDLEQLYLKGMERELEIGREIQKGFLPAELPQVDGWEIAVYFAAAREVAGDFYDAFRLGPEQQICLVVADVCDKGVGAALFMTLFRSLLRFTMGAAELFGVSSPVEKLERAVALTNRLHCQYPRPHEHVRHGLHRAARSEGRQTNVYQCRARTSRGHGLRGDARQAARVRAPRSGSSQRPHSGCRKHGCAPAIYSSPTRMVLPMRSTPRANASVKNAWSRC